MIRNLRALGFAAAATMTMSAIFVSGATAQGVLTAGDKAMKKHTVSGVYAKSYGTFKENLFTAFGQSTHCTEDEIFSFTASGTDTSLAVSPRYDDCFVLDENEEEGLPVEVTMNGCEYLFNEPEEVEAETFEGTVDLECPEGEAIEFEVYSAGNHEFPMGIVVCTQTYEPAKGLGTFKTHNKVVPGWDDVTATLKAQKVKGKKHGLCGSAETESAEYVTKLTVTSDTDDVWYSKP
ncbi:MAG TPA: hypothetical protein VNP96_10625 [Solirubrobacterales bacterium]|nr:hypothetical protein [Solirubrobacterales bacterium]